MQAVLERVEVRPGDADPAPQAGPLRLIRPVQEHLRRLRGLQGSILHHLCVTGNGDSIRLELPWSNYMYIWQFSTWDMESSNWAEGIKCIRTKLLKIQQLGALRC